MPENADSLLFQRVTGCIRKPVARFRLASGRQAELLAFHLEPAWAFAHETPRPVAAEVARRLYPNETAVVVTPPEQWPGAAFLCVAYLFSDSATRREATANCSYLLVCGSVEGIDSGIQSVVAELLSRVDWDASATNDFIW